MKKILYLLVAALLCHSALAQQPETFPVNGTYDQRDGLYAFTNATIYTNYNKKIEKATLLIQNGKVVQVGTAVTIPKNAVKIDLKGKFIYPAFIDLYTNYGLPETKSKEKRDGNPQMESDKKGAYGWNEAIRPETNANTLFDTAADWCRKQGLNQQKRCPNPARHGLCHRTYTPTRWYCARLWYGCVVKR